MNSAPKKEVQLPGASMASVYAWEGGKTRAKPEQVTPIASVRTLGKRQIAERL